MLAHITKTQEFISCLVFNSERTGRVIAHPKNQHTALSQTGRQVLELVSYQKLGHKIQGGMNYLRKYGIMQKLKKKI
jgi:hypothetical protein